MAALCTVGRTYRVPDRIGLGWQCRVRLREGRVIILGCERRCYRWYVGALPHVLQHTSGVAARHAHAVVTSQENKDLPMVSACCTRAHWTSVMN